MKEFVAQDPNSDTLEQVKNMLQEKYACYVLITCSEPKPNGQMEVDMDFEGDEDLAEMLLHQAAQRFDSKNLRKESK